MPSPNPARATAPTPAPPPDEASVGANGSHGSGGVLERPAELLSPERILAIVALALLPILAVAIFWIGQNAFFLLFAGILVAAIFDAATRLVADRGGLKRPHAFALVLALVLASIAALAWFGGSYLAGQAGELYSALDRQADRVGGLIDRFRPGRDPDGDDETPLGVLRDLGRMWGGGDGGAMGFVSATLGGLANAFIIFFVGVFLALDPDLYKRGLTRLFPRRHRGGIDEALHDAGDTLRRWLVGKLLSMALIFGLTLAGLLIAGYPLAVPLAILAGLLAFVPNLGPILTYVPIALAGFSEGTTTVLIGVAVYAVAQTVESYVFTPIIQKRMVSLPPALILFAQVLGGILFGLWGIALATPLAAVLRLWIERYYVRRELETEARQHPPDRHAATRAFQTDGTGMQRVPG